jgi:Na+/H+-dicarboxylate symporter
MRNLFALLALLGAGGVAIGIMIMLQNVPGQAGPLPFRFEHDGGPGPLLAGLILIAGSLYLRSTWQGRD